MDNMEHQRDSTDIGGDTDVAEITAADIGDNMDAVSQDWDAAFGETDVSTAAEQAADYARSLGYEKAADYIFRHYVGGEFSPEEPIQVSTRNMKLEGHSSENGIPFERRTAQLTDGLCVEGVFPEFESRHHVELGEKANDMTIYQQFNACREHFQDHMFDSPEKLEGLTLEAMERLKTPHGFAPDGYTWQHNPETGSFDLVSSEDHAVAHTGGNAFWGVFG